MQTSKERHISSNFELIHSSKVLIILNQMSSYLYGIYSQPNYSNVFNWNLFEVWNERWEMQRSETNNSAPQKFIKFTRVQSSYFATKWGPIHMVLSPSMIKTGFPSEIDLMSRTYKSTCELEMNGTAF
jgi:Sec7-like guanine-nucleotide exchange factor